MKPDVQHIAITCADDSLAVMAFITVEYVGNVPRRVAVPTNEAIAAEIARASASFDAEKLPIKSWRLMAAEEMPKDRTFRDAWRDTQQTIESGDTANRIAVHMPTAREIHRRNLRAARVPLLQALDVEYQRADEIGNASGKEAIASKKQVLRDVTKDPGIEEAQTPDELKAMWPEILGRV